MQKEIIGNHTLYCGDCLEVMQDFEKESIDCIITDLPYGTTACRWDFIIPFEPMWNLLNNICKPKSAMVFTASQPFTSALVMSNIDNFRYEWIWQKAVGSNFATLKYQPMKEHESVLVFSKNTHNYYPIMQERAESGKKRLNYGHSGSITGEVNGTMNFKGFKPETYNKDLRNPSSIQYFNNRESCRGLHPTQKPVALMEYLIKTYTIVSDVVLDFCFGSCTTGVAAAKLKRCFIGIEKEQKYFDIACRRIESEYNQQKLF
jgi:site-specific DNA-methyltransferase (adenine-specific)